MYVSVCYESVGKNYHRADKANFYPLDVEITAQHRGVFEISSGIKRKVIYTSCA